MFVIINDDKLGKQTSYEFIRVLESALGLG